MPSKLSQALANLKNSNHANTPVHFGTSERKLTSEQRKVLSSGAKKIKIQAFAGTGKTTLLQEMATQYSKANGLYLAFNKSIAHEASKSFPSNVVCKTHNALALSELRRYDASWRNVRADKLAPIYPEHISELLQDQHISSPLILKIISTYIYSYEESIGLSHFPHNDSFLTQLHSVERYEEHLKAAKTVWKEMSDANSLFPMPHDGYLKLWATNPKPLHFDFIMIDEAQDSNPSFIRAMDPQEARQIYVGDEHQGIYTFRGAINALASLKNAEENTLTITHRFGQKICAIANKIIHAKGISSTLEPSHAAANTTINYGRAPLGTKPLFLARTNAGLFRKALELTQHGKNFYLTGGADKLNFPDLADLMKLSSQASDGTYRNFKNLQTLQEQATEHGKVDLAMRAKIAIEYGDKLPDILSAINKKILNEHNKTTETPTISTIHQAKGLEFNWVELIDDFPEINATQTPAQALEPHETEEANIFYVAITRAKIGLAINNPKLQTWAQHATVLLNNKHEDEENLF
jgi:superfamily I DNA/RNA helicase